MTLEELRQKGEPSPGETIYFLKDLMSFAGKPDRIKVLWKLDDGGCYEIEAEIYDALYENENGEWEDMYHVLSIRNFVK